MTIFPKAELREISSMEGLRGRTYYMEIDVVTRNIVGAVGGGSPEGGGSYGGHPLVGEAESFFWGGGRGNGAEGAGRP